MRWSASTTHPASGSLEAIAYGTASNDVTGEARHLDQTRTFAELPAKIGPPCGHQNTGNAHCMSYNGTVASTVIGMVGSTLGTERR